MRYLIVLVNTRDTRGANAQPSKVITALFFTIELFQSRGQQL